MAGHQHAQSPGERLLAALPDGRVLSAEVREITPDRLRARVLDEQPARGISPCRITLYQSILKGEKMDLVVQKATELGVDAIVPVFTRRTVPRWAPAAARERSERWGRIAAAAAEQCERSLPPQVLSPRELARTLDEVKQFFSTHKVPDAERTLQQSMERIGSCAALATAQSAKLTAWLKR
jgi:16S rRNA (uracil1498-N3)-methyltransferase